FWTAITLPCGPALLIAAVKSAFLMRDSFTRAIEKLTIIESSTPCLWSASELLLIKPKNAFTSWEQCFAADLVAMKSSVETGMLNPMGRSIRLADRVLSGQNRDVIWGPVGLLHRESIA